MRIYITIKTENEDFRDDPSIEVARILRDLADRLDGHPHLSPGHDQALLDINGNEVGYCTVREGIE